LELANKTLKTNKRTIKRTIKVSCLSHFLQKGGCKKCAIPSWHPMTLAFSSVRVQDVTIFWLKYHPEYSGCPDAASGNFPARQAGSFAGTAHRAVPKRSALHIAGPLAARLKKPLPMTIPADLKRNNPYLIDPPHIAANLQAHTSQR